jgi:hypothetical protein
VSKKPPPKPRKGGDNSVSIPFLGLGGFFDTDIPGVCGKIK